jgi:hypothetical protein
VIVAAPAAGNDPHAAGRRSTSRACSRSGRSTVLLQLERDVDRRARRMSIARSRSAMRNPIAGSAHAPCAEHQLEVLTAADLPRVAVDADAARDEHRLRVAQAERPAVPHAAGTARRRLASVDLQVDADFRRPGRPGEHGARVLVERAARNASMRSSRTSRPAACRWPPYRSSSGAQAWMPSYRWNAGIERPLPRPRPVRVLGDQHDGPVHRSTTRDATMPITPGCQPATTARCRSRDPDRSSSSMASASSSMRGPRLPRPVLRLHLLRQRGRLRASSVSSRRTPRSRRPSGRRRSGAAPARD